MSRCGVLCAAALLLAACCADAQYISRGAKKNKMNDTLPGYNKKIPFNMYSGYLKASDKQYYHYWFVESMTAPNLDPLVLWLNGGPGCSSFSGALEELGPFNLTDNATLIDNEWAWNRQANVLFLESPGGVGYSFSADFSVNTSDTLASLHNYQALKDFFFQYPQFSRHDFYIMGESYAGVYVPTLAERIVDGQENFTINFKGIAIGNGMLSEDLNTVSTVEFSYNHGLVDEDDYELIVKRCCGGCIDACHMSNVTDAWCEEKVTDILMSVWAGGLNPYDVYRTCWHNPNLGKKVVSNGYLVRLKWMAPDFVRRRLEKMKKLQDDDDDETLVITDPTCSNETAITDYMNRPDVREAFHIPYHVGFWSTCKAHIKWQYKKEVRDVAPQVRKCLKAGVKVLIYAGDADMACNFLMSQKFAERLGLPLLESKRPFKYANAQIGGFVTRYQGLDFATIKGAGHMAPGWRPEQNYHIIDSFLRDKDY